MNQVDRIFLAHKQVFRVFSEVKVDTVSHYTYREYAFIYMFWGIEGEVICFVGFLFIPGFYYSPIHARTSDSSLFPVNLEI